MRACVLILAVAVLGVAQAAEADCTRAEPPGASARPQKPVPPTLPRCAAVQGGANVCNGGEASKYNADVAAFNKLAKAYEHDLQAYVDRLNDYVAAAQAYAKCEVAEVTR